MSEHSEDLIKKLIALSASEVVAEEAVQYIKELEEECHDLMMDKGTWFRIAEMHCNTMTAMQKEGSYSVGYKAGLEAAVKACREHAERYGKNNELHMMRGACRGLEEAIAALPVESIQWRDLTDDEIADVFWDDFSKQREEDYTWNDIAKTVIAKFKEKQL